MMIRNIWKEKFNQFYMELKLEKHASEIEAEAINTPSALLKQNRRLNFSNYIIILK